jgi:hypothetical protein
LRMMIEDLGARVASLWEGLRPATRTLVERALQSPNAGAVATTAPIAREGGGPYDSRADSELSRLLAALDERVLEAGVSLNSEQTATLRRVAETTAALLQTRTQSADVFTQLVERAHANRDYARIDTLADVLTSRFAPSEICELVRQPNPIVRALAQEALAQAPTSVLIALLRDPVDVDIARDALARKAIEYGSDDARQILNVLDLTDLGIDEA